MKPAHWISLIAAVPLTAGYLLWMYSGGLPSPNRLAQTALTAGQPNERIDAAAALTLVQEPTAVAELHRLAKETRDPEVLTIVLPALMKRNPGADTINLVLQNLEHTDKKVREGAFEAFRRMPGMSGDQKFDYNPAEPLEQSGPALKKLVAEYRPKAPTPAMMSGPATAAVAAVPPSNPATADPAKEAPPPNPAPSPTPSASPSPVPSAPMVQYDYPAIHLLIWMCRVLAVLVLIAEVAGALSLLLGENRANARSKEDEGSKGPLSPEQQIDKILAGMAMSMWSKISLLVAGAICIVGLLYAGEMIFLAARVEQTAVRQEQSAIRQEQTAIRIEQKLDNLRSK